MPKKNMFSNINLVIILKGIYKMGDNLMRIMYCSPDNEPKILKIEKDLKSISQLMKTNFFDTTIYNHDMLLIYDPKAILKYSTHIDFEGLKLRGPFIFTGNDTLEKDFKSLTIIQIRHLQKILSEKQVEFEELEL